MAAKAVKPNRRPMTLHRAASLGLWRSAAVVLAAVAVFLWAAVSALPDLLALLGAPEFDLVAAGRDYPLQTGRLAALDETGEALLSTGAGAGYDATMLDNFLYAHKLVWGGRYRFSLRPYSAGAGLVEQRAIILGGLPYEGPIRMTYLLLHYQGGQVLAAFQGDPVLQRGEALTGVFVPMDAGLLAAMQQAFGPDAEVERLFPYLFDTTRSFTWQRDGNLMWAALTAVPVAVLAIRLGRQLRDKRRRPVYRKLEMLGGDEAVLDARLAGATPAKGVYRVPGWALRAGPLTTGLTIDNTVAPYRSKWDE